MRLGVATAGTGAGRVIPRLVGGLGTAVLPVDELNTRDTRRGASGPKLAAVVAERMVADIAAAGWPDGEVIGSEAELLDRYGVSRAVFREAVRLLEHRQVGRMRRGPGGGLVVTEPSVESVMDAVMVYLLFIRAELAEVFEARTALEVAAAELAAARLTDDGLTRLRRLGDDEAAGQIGNHRDLHALLASVTGNPALEFFVDLLNRVLHLYTPVAGSITTAVLKASVGAHGDIIEAVVAGDAGTARRHMQRHLDEEADFMHPRLPATRRLDGVFVVPTGDAKLAETVARRLFVEITTSGWEVGRLLGSEAELMEQFDVSRSVLREAVRVLGHHQIAHMRRGPGGGLFVAEPGLDATTGAVAIYLSRRSIRTNDLFEVRSIIEMAVLDRVIAELDDAVVASLEAVLDAEAAAPVEDFPVVGHDLHEVLAELSGNRVLALLTGVLVALSRNQAVTPPPEAVADPLPTDEVKRTHRKIVEAIVARDADLARHRMRRHLDALIRWVG